MTAGQRVADMRRQEAQRLEQELAGNSPAPTDRDSGREEDANVATALKKKAAPKATSKKVTAKKTVARKPAAKRVSATGRTSVKTVSKNNECPTCHNTLSHSWSSPLETIKDKKGNVVKLGLCPAARERRREYGKGRTGTPDYASMSKAALKKILLGKVTIPVEKALAGRDLPARNEGEKRADYINRVL